MNISRCDAHVRVAAVVAVGLIALPGSVAARHPGVPRSAGTPELAISVTDGQVAARPGQTLTYQVSLRNTGAVSAARLEVTQTLAAGLEATTASGDGVLRAGEVSWSTAIPAGGTRTFRVTARVVKPPAQMTQLAAVACAVLPGSKQPLVCAAHLDRLPARAVAPARPGRRGQHEIGAVPYVAALTLLAGGGVAILRRRTLRRLPRHATAERTTSAAQAPLPHVPDTNHREFT